MRECRCTRRFRAGSPLNRHSDTLGVRRPHRHERFPRFRVANASSEAPVKARPAAPRSLALVDRILRAARAVLAILGSLAVGRNGLDGDRPRRGAADSALSCDAISCGSRALARRFRYSGKPESPDGSRLFPVPGAQASGPMRRSSTRFADRRFAIGLSGSAPRPTRVANRGSHRTASSPPRPTPRHRLKHPSRRLDLSRTVTTRVRHRAVAVAGSNSVSSWSVRSHRRVPR